eukprot:CAMPEP_0172328054 /NCGR_PEP_ID=MMETSP1058-20130122/60146_1 /TAXON_ID=83371 /ORGANISM="Detonula confervacea, Strain CCMP 353" /LENGTH=826 /DNA_ID=CAMNT_0013045151 /DNA_START=5978 /DNA_END=8458 /DNA_ORIENTATION=-
MASGWRGFGWPGAANRVPHIHIHIPPPSPSAYDVTMAHFSTSLYSLRNDARETSDINRKRKNKGTDTANKSKSSAFIALLCSVAILFGTPDFEGNGLPIPFDNNKAMALEPTSKDDPLESSEWTPPSSALSDKLFKSLSTRESTKDSASPIPKTKQRYWDSMKGSTDEKLHANENLIDNAVATVSTMYYDTSGGFDFNSQEFYKNWKKFRYSARHPRDNSGSGREKKNVNEFDLLVDNGFATRENTVKTLKSIVSSLNDPYSKYLTREELKMELEGGNNGFLGLGALVDVSTSPPSALALGTRKSIRPLSSATKDFGRPVQGGVSLDNSIPFNQQFTVPLSSGHSVFGTSSSKNGFLSVSKAENLPVITAIVPDSPAERAGLVVGDRIASVGDFQFTGMSRSQVQRSFNQKFHAENYFGRADLTIAKQVVATPLGLDSDNVVEEKYVFENGWYQPKTLSQGMFQNMPSEQLLGYKLSHVKSIATTLTAKLESPVSPTNEVPPGMSKLSKFPSIVGGDAIVHYELLTPDDSIFQHIMTNPEDSRPVGYIRLTRFSKAATAGYVNAINSLEEAGAQSYIIDLRNNYGGVIQEAMVTASSLLRDPYSVLCYTLNSRGGFKPQENMEYIIDRNYPGYLLSSESSTVSRDQVRREHPEYLEDDGAGWSAPTSYASLKELRMTRGIKPAYSFNAFLDRKEIDIEKVAEMLTRKSEKKVVILINEGTASAAEVFASALHDNERTLLVGTKTFGKGLIQHTFPTQDGGGLRLTVAEYLTPSLQHVTKVGGAKYDKGVKPDVRCESKQGIPQNVGADLCVGVALDVLQQLESKDG